MRIATNTLIDLGIRQMLDQQSTVARINQQISSGLRMQTAADDPAGWSLAAGYRQAVSELDRYQSNVGTARQRLSLEETALASSTQVVARVRELAIQANSGTLDTVGRNAIVSELTQLREQLMSLANSRDANGSYLFGGSRSATPAFSNPGTGVVYNGDTYQRLLDIGPGRSIADGDSGDTAFMGAGNVFQQVDDLIALVQTAPINQAAMTALQGGLSDAFDNLNNVRATVGTRLSALEGADDSLNTQRVALKTALSSVEDVDLAEAASEFNKHSLMLQAAQMAYAKVQGLTLFNYLK